MRTSGVTSLLPSIGRHAGYLCASIDFVRNITDLIGETVGEDDLGLRLKCSEVIEYAPNTLKSYYADTKAFVDWCLVKNIEPFPLTSGGIREYIETMAIDYSYASIR